MNDRRDPDATPTDSELAAAADDLQAALGGLSLNDPALWLEPSADLEDRIMAGVDMAPEPVADVGEHNRRRWARWLPASIAALIVALIAVSWAQGILF